MPHCPYCGNGRYSTYCASFYRHVTDCQASAATALGMQRQSEEMQRQSEERVRMLEMQYRHAQELLKERSKIPSVPQVINNYNINTTNYNIQMNTLYIDYPQNESTKSVIQHAKSFDVSKVKSIEDLNKIMDEVQGMNGGEIEKCLTSRNGKAKSQALSFLADVMRTIRTRMQKSAPTNTVLLEAAEDFEKDCLKDKQLVVL